MPPRYTVRARVIDIRTDTPRPTDAFLADTQVWFWVAYPGAGAMAGSATPGQMTTYSDYLRDCLAAGLHVLADKPWILALADLENRAEIGVVQSRGSPCLVEKPGFGRGVAEQLRGQELQGHGAAEPDVLRFIDHAHATAAQGLADPEMGDGAAREGGRAPIVDRQLQQLIGCACQKSSPLLIGGEQPLHLLPESGVPAAR